MTEDDSQKDKRKSAKSGPEIKINMNPIKQESTVKKSIKPPTSTVEPKKTESPVCFSDPVLLDFEADCKAFKNHDNFINVLNMI